MGKGRSRDKGRDNDPIGVKAKPPSGPVRGHARTPTKTLNGGSRSLVRVSVKPPLTPALTREQRFTNLDSFGMIRESSSRDSPSVVAARRLREQQELARRREVAARRERREKRERRLERERNKVHPTPPDILVPPVDEPPADSLRPPAGVRRLSLAAPGGRPMQYRDMVSVKDLDGYRAFVREVRKEDDMIRCKPRPKNNAPKEDSRNAKKGGGGGGRVFIPWC